MITLYSLNFIFGYIEPVQSLARVPVQPMYQCVIINGPTLATWYVDLAEPGGMSFKVAA